VSRSSFLAATIRGYPSKEENCTRRGIRGRAIYGFALCGVIPYKQGGSDMDYKGYNIEFTDDAITVNGKTMKVKFDWDYTFKLQKTQIKARDGGKGLEKFMRDCAEGRFPAECFVSKICGWVVENGR